jgi:hypothetical protein
MIRVVVGEDTYLVREGIRRLLEPEAGHRGGGRARICYGPPS